MERDPASARAEYFAEFRTDLEMLLTREAVRACVVPGCRELPPLQLGTATSPLSTRPVAASTA